MEYRFLGASGLKVPVLSFGTATFGGGNDFFKAWGSTQVDEAKKLVDICLEAGVNLFDTADIYSDGLAEEVFGKSDSREATQRIAYFDQDDVYFWRRTEQPGIFPLPYFKPDRRQP